MEWTNQRFFGIGCALCILIVFATSLPVLKAPRLEADDYRYLGHIQQVQAGKMGLLEGMVVENRWDHLWFMQENGRIRFFRPTVVGSYALDLLVWNDRHPFGLTLTNISIHLACSLLVLYLLGKTVGVGLHSLLGAALFSGLSAHAECIWYVAGRTDSLAALGFLSALSLHVAGFRWWALPFFAFGFLTKEMVVVLPVVIVVYDRWIESRQWTWNLYVAYGVLTVAILLFKRIALGGMGSDFVYPYLVSPLSTGFLEHLVLQLRSYSGNLLAAEITVPFADEEAVSMFHRTWIALVGFGGLLLATWVLRKNRLYWFFLLFGILVWLPTSFVYLSERYLYLPSVAFIAILSILASELKPKMKWVCCILFGAFTAFQSVKLHNKHVVIAEQPGSVREMVGQIEPVREKIARGGHVLLVNTPGLFVRAQFAEDVLRVVFDDPNLRVDVLTMMPGQNGTPVIPGDSPPAMGAGVCVGQAGARSVVVEGRSLHQGLRSHRVQEYGLKRFNWAPLKDGATYQTDGFNVKILDGDPLGASKIEFEFMEPVENAQVLVWRADCSDLSGHPWVRRKNAVVELLSL